MIKFQFLNLIGVVPKVMSVALIEPFDRLFLSLSKGSGTTRRNDCYTKCGGFDELNHRNENLLDSPIFIKKFYFGENMNFGKNLQYLRRLSKNLTQEELAEKLNISRQTVSFSTIPDQLKRWEDFPLLLSLELLHF